jgi:hypothetical protein
LPSVGTGTVRKDMMWYRFEERRECMTFQALMLAGLGMLSVLCMLAFGVERYITSLMILIA